MLSIRLERSGKSLNLDRKMAEAGGYGVWEFHRSASTVTHDNGHTVYRFARIKPADPKAGQIVEVALLTSVQSPEDEWIPYGNGTATIHPSF